MAHRSSQGLKVAIVTENFLPKVDGVTRTLARLLAYLRTHGHTCIVLGPESGMSSFETHSLFGTPGIPLMLYPGLKLNFFRPKFASAIAEFDPDVIHIVDPVWLGAQCLLALDAGLCGEKWKHHDTRPVVASYHTNLPQYGSLFGFKFAEQAFWRLLQRLHARCQLTACPSQSTAQLLSTNHGFKNLRLWPGGVDTTTFKPSSRSQGLRGGLFATKGPSMCNLDSLLGGTLCEKGKLEGEFHPIPISRGGVDGVAVLYVGRLSFEKNLTFLLRSFQIFLQSWLVSPEDCGAAATASEPKCPDVRFILIGDGPARIGLEAYAKELGIASHTLFLGQIDSPQRLAECYASADIFAFPSYTETFGQVVIEALACGLPVVGLDAPGTRDLVQHGSSGLLLPCSHECAEVDHQDYAALLLMLALDSQLRATMSAHAVEQANSYSWDATMSAMTDCYKETIALAAKGRENETWAATGSSRIDRYPSMITSLLGGCL